MSAVPVANVPSGVVVTSPVPATPAPAATGGTAPIAAPAAPQTMASGGTIGSVLKNTNWVEIGFYILGALALISIIAVSRKKIEQEEQANKKLAIRIDDLEGELIKLKSNKKKGIVI